MSCPADCRGPVIGGPPHPQNGETARLRAHRDAFPDWYGRRTTEPVDWSVAQHVLAAAH